VRIAKPGSNQVVSFNELASSAISAASRSLDRLLQDAEDPLGRRDDEGPAVLLFLLRRGGGEVAIDTLTGESRVLRADLVQDCGSRSIRRSISARSRAPSCRARAG
jgi:xanthine dehydrogenase large subunit